MQLQEAAAGQYDPSDPVPHEGYVATPADESLEAKVRDWVMNAFSELVAKPGDPGSFQDEDDFEMDEDPIPDMLDGYSDYQIVVMAEEYDGHPLSDAKPDADQRLEDALAADPVVAADDAEGAVASSSSPVGENNRPPGRDNQPS